MEINMSSAEVIEVIRQMNERGESLSKKRIKKHNPQLMRSALHFFPDWDHAIKDSIS